MDFKGFWGMARELAGERYVALVTLSGSGRFGHFELSGDVIF